jgi:hypothetical protein
LASGRRPAIPSRRHHRRFIFDQRSRDLSAQISLARPPRSIKETQEWHRQRKGVPFSTPFPPLTFTSFTTLLLNVRSSDGLRRPNGRLHQSARLHRRNVRPNSARCENCRWSRRGCRRTRQRTAAAQWVASCSAADAKKLRVRNCSTPIRASSSNSEPCDSSSSRSRLG